LIKLVNFKVVKLTTGFDNEHIRHQISLANKHVDSTWFQTAIYLLFTIT